jgi:predicted RNase H-like nuclease (RuvC/YqgF family)
MDLNNIFQAQYAGEKSKKLNGDKIYADALEVEELMNQAKHHSQQIVMEVNSLAYSLDGGASPQAAIEAVQEAEIILAEIRSRDLGPSLDEAKESLAKVEVLLQRMKDFALPVANQTAELEQLKDQVDDFSARMDDLKQHSEDTIFKAYEHEDLNLLGKYERIFIGCELHISYYLWFSGAIAWPEK